MNRLIILLALLTLIATPAIAGDFIQFTAPDGSIAFTDDAKRVPKAATDVTERTWEEVRENTRPRTTVVPASEVAVVVPQTRTGTGVDVIEANPNRQRDCTGPLTVTKTRRQVGEYNRTFWLAFNRCGDLVFESISPINSGLEIETGE